MATTEDSKPAAEMAIGGSSVGEVPTGLSLLSPVPPFRAPSASLVTPLAFRPRIVPRRALRVLGALLFASACCLVLLAAKRWMIGRWTDTFMVWNLGLAWMPLPFSVAAYRMHTTRTRRSLLFFSCALTWFFFFPNAPYITTDFVHLRWIQDETFMLFTILPIAAFAWVGLCLGFCSLYLMQEVVRHRFGRVAGWAFVLAMLAAASFGTFLGRFQRWNSWDVLHQPLQVISGAMHHVSLPFREFSVYLGMMFLFLLLSYSSLYALMHLHERPTDRTGVEPG